MIRHDLLDLGFLVHRQVRASKQQGQSKAGSVSGYSSPFIGGRTDLRANWQSPQTNRNQKAADSADIFYPENHRNSCLEIALANRLFCSIRHHTLHRWIDRSSLSTQHGLIHGSYV
jgi:hypothetical protein